MLGLVLDGGYLNLRFGHLANSPDSNIDDL